MAERKIINTLLRPLYRKGAEASFTVPGFLNEESRLLCIDPGDLSDVLFHMPLLTAIRRRYPGTKMDFLLPEKHAPLVVPSGLARQCTLYKPGQLNPWRPSYNSLLRKLGAGRYDAAIVMATTPQPPLELAALASGAALRFGPSHEDSWPAVNFELRIPADAGYIGDRLRHAAPFLGFAPEDMKTRWPLPMDKVRQKAQQVHFHKPNPDQMLIGIDPGPGKSGHAFALENMQFLVRQLTSQLVCKVLALGDPEQKERLARFEGMLSGAPLGLERDTLLETILLLVQCDLFVSGNTDFFHFAVAQGVPAVGLFSQAEAAHWVPVDRPRARVITVTEGEKVDIETLMEAVEAVTEGRTSTASSIITSSAAGEPGPETPPPAADD